MQKIRGKGPSIVAGEIVLEISRDKLGDAVAIQVSEPANSESPWTVTVQVGLAGGGVFTLGEFTTRPPAAGDRATRVVALGYCPGVKQWKLFVRGPRNAIMRIGMATSEISGGVGVEGLVPVNGTRVAREVWDQPASPIVSAIQGVLTPGPGTLQGGYGFTDPATPAGFFGFVDKATPVVNGDPWRIAPVPVGGLGVADRLAFNFHPDGVDFANQARWVLSSTLGTVTLLGAGGAVFQGDRI